MITTDDIPTPRRRINFIGCNEKSDYIRGRQFFEEMSRLMPDYVRVNPSHLEKDRCGLYVILMPATGGVVSLVESVSHKLCSCRSVVDIHADFWDPNYVPISDDLAWWQERVPMLEQCIKVADIVTVPDKRYINSLESFTSRITIVPDCSDGVLTEETALGWTQAVTIAGSRSHSG